MTNVLSSLQVLFGSLAIGARTVIGGPFASTYPQLCRPFFDAVVVGDPESTVPHIHADFAAGRLAPHYRAGPYDPEAVPTPRFDLVAGRPRSAGAVPIPPTSPTGSSWSSKTSLRCARAWRCC